MTSVGNNASTATDPAVAVVSQICACDTAAHPGYSTSRMRRPASTRSPSATCSRRPAPSRRTPSTSSCGSRRPATRRRIPTRRSRATRSSPATTTRASTTSSRRSSASCSRASASASSSDAGPMGAYDDGPPRRAGRAAFVSDDGQPVDLPSTVFALRWLARDTVRQARASGLLWAALLATAVATAFCLSLSVHGDRPVAPLAPAKSRPSCRRPRRRNSRQRTFSRAKWTCRPVKCRSCSARSACRSSAPRRGRSVGCRVPGGGRRRYGRRAARAVVDGRLPAGVPGTSYGECAVGQAGAAVAMFAGKVAGVLALVAACAAAYLAATFVALGVATKVWEPRYWAALPILLVHFTAFFGASAALAVWTRSAVIAGLGTVLAWLACWAVNYAHATAPGGVTSLAYWLLPKPAEFSALLFQGCKRRGARRPTRSPAARKQRSSPRWRCRSSAWPWRRGRFSGPTTDPTAAVQNGDGRLGPSASPVFGEVAARHGRNRRHVDRLLRRPARQRL